MIKQDILEKQVKSSYLAIGSNLGDRLTNIEEAKRYLMLNNIHIENSSSYYETPSWPNRNFPKFLNIVIKVNTDLPIVNLFKIIKAIEKKSGRKKNLKNYPRICDIDIIDFNGFCLSTSYKDNEITIPHKNMHNRSFVLLPLYEIDKNWIHPKYKKNIVNLLHKLSIIDLSSIKLM